MMQQRILPLGLVLAGIWLVYGCSGGETGGGGTAGDTGTTGSAGTSATAGTSGAAGTSGNAGTTGAAGTTPTAGRGGTGGTGTGGRGGTTATTGTGGQVAISSLCTTWPTATRTLRLRSTQAISGTYDGGMRRFVGAGPLGTATQNENQDPLLKIANGATLQNLIIGSPAADGIHCDGTCTLKNVWWEDVG